jgi:hypothetical protein
MVAGEPGGAGFSYGRFQANSGTVSDDAVRKPEGLYITVMHSALPCRGLFATAELLDGKRSLIAPIFQTVSRQNDPVLA